MNRLLSFVLLLVVIGVCLGFFRGWFSLSTNSTGSQGNTNIKSTNDDLDIHFRVDKDKMKQDANTVQENTKVLLGNEKGDTSLPR